LSRGKLILSGTAHRSGYSVCQVTLSIPFHPVRGGCKASSYAVVACTGLYCAIKTGLMGSDAV